MQALITGGTGFLGANLADGLLKQGWDVRILRRSTSPLDAVQDLNVEHAIGDVTHLDSLLAAMQGIEIVFNVAAISSYWRNTAELIYKVNVDGARNVFEAAARSGVRRVVHTSSAAAVGIISGRSATEADPFNQPARQFPYGHSKWLTEAIVRERVAAGQDIVMVNPVRHHRRARHQLDFGQYSARGETRAHSGDSAGRREFCGGARCGGRTHRGGAEGPIG